MTLAWCFADESTNYTRRVLAAIQADSLHVPMIWHHELQQAARAAGVPSFA